MNEIKVPELFQRSMPFNYPIHHKGLLIEEYFYDFFKRLPEEDRDEIEIDYLPIFWTAYHCRENWGNNTKPLQDFLNSLPKDKYYYTLVQYDDGTKVTDGNLITFSSSKNNGSLIDLPIPLLCSQHGISHESDKYLVSFMGRIGQRVRPKMFEFMGKYDKCIIKDIGEDVETFRYYLKNSTFSLCPRGYGVNSFRLYESFECGTIPIYIVEDGEDHWLPFSSEINWNEICILLKESDIPRIPEILESFSKEEIEKMRETIRSVYIKYFTFESVCINIIKSLKKLNYNYD